MSYDDAIMTHFTIGDYVVFSALLGISLAIGLYFSRRGNDTANDFLLGGRSMPVIPVSMSLIASSISAISLLGTSGEIYGNGLILALNTIGAIIGLLVASYLFIPVFYELKITTINEYISLRFRSKYLRTMVMILGMFKNMTYTGICLYAPTVALSSVTPLDSDTYVIVLGIVCTVYSTIGGMKAVVWTDVFQTIVMFGGVIAIIAITTAEVGGFKEVFHIASVGGRTDVLNFDLHPHVRHNTISIILMGFLFKIAIFGTSQIYLQRICSVGSLREARGVAFITAIGQIFIFSLVYYSGLCAYAMYDGCDPISLGFINKKDQIMPYLVMEKMNYFYLPGIFVATVFSGALSSLSSMINASAAILWVDVLQLLPIFKNSSERTAAIINKLLSALVGAFMIGIGFMAKYLGGLIEATMTVGGVTAGPLLGVFFIGTCCPWIGAPQTAVGLLVSWIIMVWIGLGGFIYKPKVEYLPLKTDRCSEFNISTTIMSDITANITNCIEEYIGHGRLTNETDNLDFTLNCNNTEVNNHTTLVNDGAEEFPLLNLYKLSYTWYPLCGFILCMIISFTMTCFTGRTNVDEVPLSTLAIPIRRRLRNKRNNRPEIIFGNMGYSKVEVK